MNKRYSVFLENVPSSNTLYATNFSTGRRFLSKKGAAWKGYTKTLKSGEIRVPGYVDQVYRDAKLPRFSNAKHIIELVAYWPNRRKTDLQNYHKPIADSLKECGYFEDDWNILMRDMDFFYPDDAKWKARKEMGQPCGILITIFEKEGA